MEYEKSNNKRGTGIPHLQTGSTSEGLRSCNRYVKEQMETRRPGRFQYFIID